MKVAGSTERLVHIKAGRVRLEGVLAVPEGACGIALFAHGSGSSRLSPRNNFVAQVLQKAGLATFLTDLLTREEDLDYEKRFDIDLLTERLKNATEWLKKDEEASGLKIGYFGASTGAAAAIKAAVAEGASIGAIVSRGGRPDLAEDSLAGLKAPILFIVGGRDDIVVELNRMAYSMVRCEKKIVIVPGATHLFEEPGTLEEAANHAALWFKEHLVR